MRNPLVLSISGVVWILLNIKIKQNGDMRYDFKCNLKKESILKDIKMKQKN